MTAPGDGPLRALLVSLRWPPHVAGGYELFARDAARELAERGVEVSVLCGRSRELGGDGVLPWLEPAIDTGEDLFERSWRASNAERFRLHFLRVANWRATARALELTGADVLFYTNLGLLSLGPLLAARTARVPTLGFAGDLWPLNHWVSDWREAERSAGASGGLRLAALAGAWRALRGAVGLGRLLAPSDYVRSRLVADGVPAGDVRVLPHGLLREMAASARGAEPRRRRPGEPLRVVCTSMLWTGKGQHVLLAAAALAVTRGADLQLALCGGGAGDYRARLEALAAEPPLAGRVRLLGRLPAEEVGRELRAAHVLAFPSLWGEPFGLATLEGMAHGLAPLATDAGATPEIVRAGVDGLVVPAGDAEAMARGLVALAEDEELRLRLATAARARALTDYDSRPFHDELERELRAACGGGAR